MKKQILLKIIKEEIELATKEKYYVCLQRKDGHNAMYKPQPFFSKEEAEDYADRLNRVSEVDGFDNESLNGVVFYVLGPTDLTPFQLNVRFGNY